MDIASSAASEHISHKVTDDERKILSRLVLKKILEHDSARFLSKDSREQLTKVFLSESPDQELALNFREPGVDAYDGGICSLTLKWVRSAAEINDLDGNVWATFGIEITGGISSMYSSHSAGPEASLKKFMLRSECIALVGELVEDVRALVPNPVRIQFLDNEGRIARDKKNRHDAAVAWLTNALVDRYKLRSYRTGLRVGGNCKAVHKEHFAEGVKEPGTFVIQVREGSKRRPVYKSYRFDYKAGGSYATIRRIA